VTGVPNLCSPTYTPIGKKARLRPPQAPKPFLPQRSNSPLHPRQGPIPPQLMKMWKLDHLAPLLPRVSNRHKPFHLEHRSPHLSLTYHPSQRPSLPTTLASLPSLSTLPRWLHLVKSPSLPWSPALLLLLLFLDLPSRSHPFKSPFLL
jgi:hypothetical protein